MTKLLLALIVVAALAMSIATVSTASAVTLILPNDVTVEVPDAVLNADGAGPVMVCPPSCGAGSGF